MEVNDQNMAQVQALMLQALSSDNAARRQAEDMIASLEVQQGFSIVVLSLIQAISASDSAQDKAIRSFGAVLFKNMVKKRWVSEDEALIPMADRESIKSHLVELMCSTPAEVQRQLAEAVTIISTHDFPGNWSTLLPHLVQKMDTQDIHVLHGVMLTTNSILKCFRNVHKSDPLYEKLLYCLEQLQEPITKKYVEMGTLLTTVSAVDFNQTLMVMETLRLMTRIFFSLNWQDIPEYFEDNSSIWMTEFSKYLAYENPSLEIEDETNEPGCIEKLKAAIIENLVLYATKYEEMFTDYLSAFTSLIWQLLVGIKSQPKFDVLATVSIKFLTTVSSKQMNMHLFTDEILQQIVEHIVVPNLMATELDEEIFEDNPLDYIRKDIEGSDQDTRRRCSVDLVRSLLKFFPEKTTQLGLSYISGMLSQYQTTMDWRAKDGALHLVIAVAVMSTSATTGAGALNPEVNILDIFNTHVLPELHDPDVNARPIVKADAVKMICTFRSHFPVSFLLELMPHLIRLLSSEYIVVQTYAAMTIERFLTLRDTAPDAPPGASRVKGELRLGKDALAPFLNPLFSALFPVLENPDLPENDYVMKCVMRVLSVVGSNISSVTELVLQHLTSALERVCKNPTNPHFNHYLFECIALLVRSCCSPSALRETHGALSPQQQAEAANASFDKFEALLFPPFQSVLQLDVVEFVPYVFQVLAQLLSYRPQGVGLSPAYAGLFPPLLSPVLWNLKGNIPALSELILAYIEQGIQEIISNNQLEGVLGIFQKLLSTKSSEVYAFKLLNALVRSCPNASLAQYYPMLMQLLLMRMQEHKTVQYCKLFVNFICLASVCEAGPAQIYQHLEGVQAGMMSMVIQQIWLPNSQAFCDAEAIVVAQLIVGGTRLLCETPIAENSGDWAALATCLVTLVGSNPSSRGNLSEFSLMDEENEAREFDSTYSKLAFAHVDDKSEIEKVDFKTARLGFATAVGALSAQFPNRYGGVVSSALDEARQSALQEVLQEAGVTLR
jgi:exportin-2 (importin alpha re-exporter)